MTKTFDNICIALRKMFVSMVMTVGMLIAPASPAVIFGFSLVRALSTSIGDIGAIVAGVSLAILLECAGITSAHVAMFQYKMWHNKDSAAESKFYLALALVIAYTGVGIVGLWYFEQDIAIEVGGTLAYLVAPIMYIASGLVSDMDLSKEDNKASLELQKDELKWQREQKEMKAKRNHELKVMAIDHQQKKQEEPLKNGDRKEVLREYLRENDGVVKNKSALAIDLNVSRPTLNKWLKEYE